MALFLKERLGLCIEMFTVEDALITENRANLVLTVDCEQWDVRSRKKGDKKGKGEEERQGL